MGRFRPKGSAFWQDPFVAYYQSGDDEPTSVHSREGKALWREYATLFLSRPDSQNNLGKKRKILHSPSVVNQIYHLEDERSVLPHQLYQFRCIGVRTDQAKVFDWIDETLNLPIGLMREPRSAMEVQRGIEHAEQCEQAIVDIFQDYFRAKQRGKHKKPGQMEKRERFKTLRERMRANYWMDLSLAFREFVLSASDSARLDDAVKQWVDTIIAVARYSFEEAVKEVGDRGSDLRYRVQAVQCCHIRLAVKRKEWINGDK